MLCDYGTGDKSKVERLRQSQILKTGRVLTAADFSGKSESDIEDLFHPDFYCALVNQSFGLTDGDAITPKKAAEAGGGGRIVKQVEATFRTLQGDFPVFGHFVPANWLLRHPKLLDVNTADVAQSMDQFEPVFKSLNGFIS